MGLKSFVTVSTLCNAGRFLMSIIQHRRKNARGKFNQKLYILRTVWYNTFDIEKMVGGRYLAPEMG